MHPYAAYFERYGEHGSIFLAGIPCVYHCHHFNLFHDQTIDDILGESAGFELRMKVARNHFRELFARLARRTGKELPNEIVALAQALLASLGHGRLICEGTGLALRAEGEYLHYGFAWKEKYGSRVRRLDPADAVAAGAVAAIAELTGQKDQRLIGRELQCVAMRAPRCVFAVDRDLSRDASRPISLEELRKHIPGGVERGLYEEEIHEITTKLIEFLRSVSGDERGLIEGFNVFVTLHLASYYNDTAFEAIRHIEAVSPGAVSSAESLLREAGHVCVFNTFGNIILSPEWEALVGPLTGDPRDVVRDCTAIARGLGFGHWAIAEHIPGKRIVLRTTANYEAAHWLHRFGPCSKSRSYFMQGAGVAFLVLSTRVRWKERPQLTQAFYDGLFHGGDLGVRLEVPRCITMGHEVTEVVVEAK
ncbi:MAG: hypothetical protein RMJ84_07490 [Sandaracinaceae bacterium]|nr:hypothetical protein [Sandaracinaceae bacterium]